jgi:hypothetical protein
VEIINGLNAPVVAAIYERVSADTGEILGNAVMADLTLRLPEKRGTARTGNVYRGVVVADIGIPAENALKTRKRFTRWKRGCQARIPKRKRVSHKGDYGKILILAAA